MAFHLSNYWRCNWNSRKNKIIFFSCTLLIVFFVFNSNRQFSIVKGMFDYADKHCQQNTDCVVNISKITPFKWDTLYVIDSGWDLDEIKSVIGAELKERTDIFSKIIFVKDGQVVYFEEYYYYPDSGGKKILVLDFDYENQEKGLIAYYRVPREAPKIVIKMKGDPSVEDKIYYLFSSANEQQVQRNPSSFRKPS
ncbi:hypothetical protein [Photorhabdus bodei]|uniref:Uncharacterized protein n=1 Tax=Photorhabdus bodei TaxID=2029681 RepID=A0A329X4K8_9GAMM|nr:hypothetical protein [Photorhabdus bodei]NDK99614.1 hypothetical protein [Photorhabdus bodei]NDL03988.1 hypothetical protein [Photorhabdus bodei]NDL08106.1 hypothetical protein [Photorhabdus bodei]RAX11814.1 hypothetical protein CKY02_12540 [Photorhabdus bodei]